MFFFSNYYYFWIWCFKMFKFVFVFFFDIVDLFDSFMFYYFLFRHYVVDLGIYFFLYFFLFYFKSIVFFVFPIIPLIIKFFIVFFSFICFLVFFVSIFPYSLVGLCLISFYQIWYFSDYYIYRAWNLYKLHGGMGFRKIFARMRFQLGYEIQHDGPDDYRAIFSNWFIPGPDSFFHFLNPFIFFGIIVFFFCLYFILFFFLVFLQLFVFC